MLNEMRYNLLQPPACSHLPSVSHTCSHRDQSRLSVTMKKNIYPTCVCVCKFAFACPPKRCPLPMPSDPRASDAYPSDEVSPSPLETTQHATPTLDEWRLWGARLKTSPIRTPRLPLLWLDGPPAGAGLSHLSRITTPLLVSSASNAIYRCSLSHCVWACSVFVIFLWGGLPGLINMDATTASTSSRRRFHRTCCRRCCHLSKHRRNQLGLHLLWRMQPEPSSIQILPSWRPCPTFKCRVCWASVMPSMLTTPIPDNQVKLGAQVVQLLVQHGFVGPDKWKNVILVGTKADRAKTRRTNHRF